MEVFKQERTGQPLQILGFDVYNGNSLEVAKFRQEAGWTFPIFMNAMDMMWDYYRGGTEEFFVIDGNGIIVYRSVVGFDSVAINQAVDAAIKCLGKKNCEVVKIEPKTPAANSRLNAIITPSGILVEYRTYETNQIQLTLHTTQGRLIEKKSLVKKRHGVYHQLVGSKSTVPRGNYIIQLMSGRQAIGLPLQVKF